MGPSLEAVGIASLVLEKEGQLGRKSNESVELHQATMLR